MFTCLRRKRISCLFGLLYLQLMIGCTLTQPSAESRYYLLSAPALKASDAGKAENTVVVGPLNFADYILRSAMVTSVTDNEVAVAKFEQWGGKIEDEFQIALLKNLSAMSPELRFLRYPSLVSLPDVISLRADILRFDARLNSDARLEVNWALVGRNGVLNAGHFSGTAEAGDSLATAVAAQSRLVSDFAEDVSVKLAEAY